MTENKRFMFVIDNGENVIYDLSKKGSVLENFNEIEEVLNNLNDENKELQGKYDRQLWEYNGLGCEYDNLKKENKELKELVREVDNELEIRDIVCGAGKFRLEEWGKHRYHQFYKGDEELEDETVVIMLMELEKENKELKELLKLISRAYSITKDESVKEILRDEIRGIDTVTEYSAMAWNEYCILSNFFEKQYGEHWDNE